MPMIFLVPVAEVIGEIGVVLGGVGASASNILWLTRQFSGGIAENLLGRPVVRTDGAAAVDNEDRFNSRVDDDDRAIKRVVIAAILI
jgi:hypothetical protein